MPRAYQRNIVKLCRAVTFLAAVGFLLFAAADIVAYFRSENPTYLEWAKEALSAAVGSAALYLFVHLSGKAFTRSD